MDDPSLSAIIATLEAKPGKDWTREELEACRRWLISEKWSDLQREVAQTLPSTPADHGAGVMAAFLNGEFEPILNGYKPGHNGLLPYVLICLRRYCWRAASQLNRERGLTRPIQENEADLAFPDPGSPAAGAPPDTLLGQGLQVLIQRELATLEPSYREPLLRCIRGATYEEIARELGLSITVVKIRIFRARQKLRKALRTAWPEAIF